MKQEQVDVLLWYTLQIDPNRVYQNRTSIRKRREGMAEVETKHDKFKRLATPRVTNALKKIELIGNLSSSGYEYTPEEVEKIFTALQQTLDSTKARFSKGKKEEPKKFEL
jgi:hypothetical protein